MKKKKRKALTFAEKLEKTVERHNKRMKENTKLYAKACKKAGVKFGEPVNILTFMEEQ